MSEITSISASQITSSTIVGNMVNKTWEVSYECIKLEFDYKWSNIKAMLYKDAVVILLMVSCARR